MVLIVVLVVLLFVLGAAGIVLWTRLAASGGRTIAAPAGEFEELFRGGVMSRYVLTSGTLARLELFSWGVRLQGISISRWIVPTWEARYDELAIAELVALPASRIAVCFRLRSGVRSGAQDGARSGAQGGEASTIAFLCDRSSAILPVLERHGVPVNRSVTRIRRVSELYR